MTEKVHVVEKKTLNCHKIHETCHSAREKGRMASSEKNRYFDLRKMSFLKKIFLGTIFRQDESAFILKEAILPFSQA